MDPADQPTIEEILDSYGLSDILNPNEYGQLLAELQTRDNVLRTDAAEYQARKMYCQGLDRIINQQ